MSALTLIAVILVAWVLLSLALGLAALLVFGARARRRDRRPSPSPAPGADRRARSRDRRIGLPDTRAIRNERRSGIDRRWGPGMPFAP